MLLWNGVLTTIQHNMNEDNLYLLLGFLIYSVILTILTIRSKNKLKTLTINLVILCIYSGLFIYNMVYNGKYGSGFLWQFYLACSIGLHLLINSIGIVLTFIKK